MGLEPTTATVIATATATATTTTATDGECWRGLAKVKRVACMAAIAAATTATTSITVSVVAIARGVVVFKTVTATIISGGISKTTRISRSSSTHLVCGVRIKGAVRAD